MNKDTYIKKQKMQNKETHDFDLTAQKKPRKSTLKKQLKLADSLNFAIPREEIVNDFDRLKFWVDLEKYADFIEFKVLFLKRTKYPSLNPYKRSRCDYEDMLSGCQKNTSRNNDYFEFNLTYEDDDNEESDYIFDDIENEEIPDEFASFLNELEQEVEEEYDFLNKDYAIYYDTFKKTLGLNNIYIQRRRLVIDVTGKFIASNGYLGKINRDNIRDCLQKILDLHVVSFNIVKFLEVAGLYSLDNCADTEYDNGEKIKSVIEGTSSLFPLSTDLHRVYKYRRTGLLLTKKAKNNGEALTLYHKGEEILYRNGVRYQHTIGVSGIEKAKKTLRIELKLYKLKNIREAFDIKPEKYAVVRLMDVLNSKATPIIKAFKKFGADPKELKNRIYGWLEKEPEIDKGISEKSLVDVLLAERYVELLKENNYDIIRTRNHIKTEYSGLVSEDTIKKFNELANSRDNILNFLIYRKPKSITITLRLLAKIYKYYGMELGGTGD